MANDYIHTAFSLTITAKEAAIIAEAVNVNALLGKEEELDLQFEWAKLDPHFRETFAHDDPEDPFGNYLEIFPDPGWPGFSPEPDLSGARKPRRQRAPNTTELVSPGVSRFHRRSYQTNKIAARTSIRELAPCVTFYTYPQHTPGCGSACGSQDHGVNGASR